MPHGAGRRLGHRPAAGDAAHRRHDNARAAAGSLATLPMPWPRLYWNARSSRRAPRSPASAERPRCSWSRYAQMRYVGQGFEIHVDLPDGCRSMPTIRPKVHRGVPRRPICGRTSSSTSRAWLKASTGRWSRRTRGQARRRYPHDRACRAHPADGGHDAQAWFPEAGGLDRYPHPRPRSARRMARRSPARPSSMTPTARWSSRPATPSA